MDIKISANPKPISFGIYKGYIKKPYGDCLFGKYKDYNIEIYDAKMDDTKLYYITNSIGEWVMSKLVYIHNGIKKIVRSYGNGLQR